MACKVEKTTTWYVMSFNYAAGQEVWNRYLYWHLKLETVSHNSSILEWPHSKVNCKIKLVISLCADASNYYHGQADIPLPVKHEKTCPIFWKRGFVKTNAESDNAFRLSAGWYVLIELYTSHWSYGRLSTPGWILCIRRTCDQVFTW